jgi:hypothetical protein
MIEARDAASLAALLDTGADVQVLVLEQMCLALQDAIDSHACSFEMIIHACDQRHARALSCSYRLTLYIMSCNTEGKRTHGAFANLAQAHTHTTRSSSHKRGLSDRAAPDFKER